MLQATDVSYVVGGANILRNIDVHIRRGAFVGVVGPNGAGKTTLMRLLSGVLRPTSGRVLFEGNSVHAMSDRERARSIAYMSQNPGIGFGFTVRDVVTMGRYAHRRGWRRLTGTPRAARRSGSGVRRRSEETDRIAGGTGSSAWRQASRGLLEGAREPRWGSSRDADRWAVQRAMEATDVAHLQDRPVTNLSGGERQRVFLARTLAQEPRLLFLDEPTSDLDIRFQLEILELVRRLHGAQGLTVVMAIHDLTWALRYCDDILALKAGRVAAYGPTSGVLTEALIYDVFEVQTQVGHSVDGRPRIDVVGVTESLSHRETGATRGKGAGPHAAAGAVGRMRHVRAERVLR